MKVPGVEKFVIPQFLNQGTLYYLIELLLINQFNFYQKQKFISFS